MLGHTQHRDRGRPPRARLLFSAMFLDTSLEDMGIHTVADMRARFRERHGLLGPSVRRDPRPAGARRPAGPGPALRHGRRLSASATSSFPVTIGDGGLGEPYIMSAFQHFAHRLSRRHQLPAGAGLERLLARSTTAWCRCGTTTRMTAYWRAHGFDEVHPDRRQRLRRHARTRRSMPTAPPSASPARMAFTGAMLKAADAAATSALSGRRTASSSSS